MRQWQLAVLERDNVTIESIKAHLAKSMRSLLCAGTIGDYRLDGQITAAWDPD
jgi:hypothetical protein